MDSLKRILILTADVGFGHRSAANAIAAALEETYRNRCVVDIVNPLDDERTPAMLHDSQEDYDRLVREMPEFYRLRYQISDTSLPNTIMESAVTVLLFSVIQDIIRRYQPDVILTTHPMYPAPLQAVLAVSKRKVPYLTVVTDLTQVHRMWFNDSTDLCLVPTKNARATAIENKIPEDRVKITGIPVHPDLAREKRSRAEIRAELGWRPDLTTALVVGSKRVKNLDETLFVLNHSGFPLQLVVVAGGDDDLFARLQQTEWHGVAHLYNFVTQMPAFLRASDLVFTKAGGLILTESLACGLPMLLVDVTPGQEEGNAEYVVRKGAAELAGTPLHVLETVSHWLTNDQALLRKRASAALALSRPHSAYEVADYAWLAAERGPLPILESTANILPKIMDMLTRSGLAGDSSSNGDESQLVHP